MTTVPLTESVAVVCGSGGAVGAALVTQLRRSGSVVIALDPHGAASHSEATHVLCGDLTQENEWKRFVAAIRALDLAPSLVAFTLDATDRSIPALELRQGEWDRVLNHNLRGAYLACKWLFPLMQGPGAVVLSTSVLGDWDTRPDAVALHASAAGVRALARTLALSGAPLGIRINVVCYDAPLPPAWSVDAALRRQAIERIPLGRETTPENVADAICFLLGDDAAYLTGIALVVDGGQSLQSWSNAPV